ncbi:hypothetical protein [Pelagibaculum spongiae]|uniref:Uncharacterized protein n=1 Tax=Pelagibaculum spongiae TaxID=2080658 RepID=A0A2V1GRY7_9GAMM|nr:hypothetical protein [Pelagibaculum spongiae]PVZ66734.1 hypothetical protein DC094_15820 [Pelagibaculum spongiae]
MKKFIITSTAALMLSASLTAIAVNDRSAALNYRNATVSGAYGTNIEVKRNQPLKLAFTQGESVNFVSLEAFRTCDLELLTADATNRFSSANYSGGFSSIAQDGTASRFQPLKMSEDGELFVEAAFDVIDDYDVGILNPAIPYQEDGKTYGIGFDGNNNETLVQGCVRGKKFTISLPEASKTELQETITKLKSQNARQNDWFLLTQSQRLALNQYFFPNSSTSRFSIGSLDGSGNLRIKNPDGSPAKFSPQLTALNNLVYWNTLDQLGNSIVKYGAIRWFSNDKTYGQFNLNGNNAPKPGQAIIIQKL